MDDQRREFKRAFAAALITLRAEAADPRVTSQKSIAPLVSTSEATYRRWEALEEPHLPDAWQLQRLCEVLGCEPKELINPEALNERQRQLARRAARSAGRGARRAGGGE